MSWLARIRREAETWWILADTGGSQIAELAISLPLLVFVVVGIMDFGGAVNLKHKLDLAAQEGARVAANETYADITQDPAPSTDAVRSAIDSYLLSVRLKNCGLGTVAGVKGTGALALQWTYTAVGGGCPAPGLTLVVNRGSAFVNATGTPQNVEATKVTLSYPYQWSFGRVVRLVVPAGTFVGPTQLTAEAVAPSLN